MAKRTEEGQVVYAGGTAFEIMQYLAKPFDFTSWRKDRTALKSRAKPLITQEQIDEGLKHKTIKRYMGIWHVHCYYTEEEEAEDKTGNIKTGEKKFPHLHLYLDTGDKYLTADVIARWFGVPVEFVEVMKGKGAFLDGCAYGLHETPKAIAAGKSHYEADEAFCSEGFDLRAELDAYFARKAEFGGKAAGMSDADVMRMRVLREGWSLRQCEESDPLTFAKSGMLTNLQRLRLFYLQRQPPCPFRLNIYIEGGSGFGKSQFGDAIAQALFPDIESPIFWVGNDERVTFDGYDGNPVVGYDEMRAVDFIAQFHRKGALRLLDNHPKNDSQQAKNSRVILTNAVNIINGIESYEDFMDGLAGAYTDKEGKEHEAEDDTQVYRRIPLVIRVRRDDFDLLVNRGFLDNNLFAVKQFELHQRVAGSIKRTLERLDGEAHIVTMGKLTSPVVETVRMIEASHDDKLTDPALIPDEFDHYGDVLTREQLLDEYENIFKPLWRDIHAKEIASGKLQPDQMIYFEDWVRSGAGTAYDKKVGFYRPDVA